MKTQIKGDTTTQTMLKFIARNIQFEEPEPESHISTRASNESRSTRKSASQSAPLSRFQLGLLLASIAALTICWLNPLLLLAISVAMIYDILMQ